MHDYHEQEDLAEKRWELWDGEEMPEPVVRVATYHPLAARIIEYVREIVKEGTVEVCRTCWFFQRCKVLIHTITEESQCDFIPSKYRRNPYHATDEERKEGK